MVAQIQSFVNALRSDLSSSDSLILTDPQDPQFKAALERWSNIDLEVPGAIIRPTTEADVITTVHEALKSSIPFVSASGGHSTWSTTNENGFVLDLSAYQGIVPDSANDAVTVKGGVLMKDLQVVLSKEGRFTTVGNGNTVGVIPYFINGGISIYTPLVGFACENIVSAKLITASGDIVTASHDQNADLFWAVRGAGQFFGVVLELVIQTYPLSLIGGSPEGTRQLGTFVYLPGQVNDVSRVLNETLVANKTRVSAGHYMILTAPPDFSTQVIAVAAQYLGSAEDAATAFTPLIELGPIQQLQVPCTFETHSDHLDALGVKGEYKRFTQIGVSPSPSTGGGLDETNVAKLVELHAQLLATCPDAKRSMFSIEWHSPTQVAKREETAFGCEEVDFWLNVLSWYSDPSLHDQIIRFDKAAQAQVRVGTAETDYVAYTNTSREDPLEYRYKGAERIARLHELKKTWDPKGVFTRELL